MIDPASSRHRPQFKDIRDAVWNCPLRTTSKMVALSLVEHWPRIFPAIARICKMTDSLRDLETREVIATTRRRGTSSTYQFVGVSIPALGVDPGDGGDGDGAELEADPMELPRQLPPPRRPRQQLPPGPAAAAPPPRQQLPPKGEDLTRKLKVLGKRASAQRGKPRSPTPIFHSTLEGWEPSNAIRIEARRLGLTDEALDKRIRRMRLTRIGGRGGVKDRDGYIMGWLEQWAAWEVENLEKAQRRAGIAPRLSGWAGGDTWRPGKQMKAYAAEHGLPIDKLARAFVDASHGGPSTAERCGNQESADKAFIRILLQEKRALADQRARRAGFVSADDPRKETRSHRAA